VKRRALISLLIGGTASDRTLSRQLTDGCRAYRGFQKKFGARHGRRRGRILCDQHRRIVAYSVPNWRNFVH
jgi:hypothetical protein